MAHSMTITDTDGAHGVDLSDYEMYLIDGDFPLLPAPHSETVNLPGINGGYTYVSLPDAEPLTLTLICNAGSTSLVAAALQALAAATPISTEVRLYPDVWPELYWVGRRTSRISGLPIGTQALQFELEFTLDDPRARLVATGEQLG